MLSGTIPRFTLDSHGPHPYIMENLCGQGRFQQYDMFNESLPDQLSRAEDRMT
jgi:hypothetical protein